jgi:hypothetical protein
MGRADAQRQAYLQDLQPWDSGTAVPEAPFGPEGMQGILRALRKWEKDRGLAVDLHAEIRLEIQTAIARRRLIASREEKEGKE